MNKYDNDHLARARRVAVRSPGLATERTKAAYGVGSDGLVTVDVGVCPDAKSAQTALLCDRRPARTLAASAIAVTRVTGVADPDAVRDVVSDVECDIARAAPKSACLRADGQVDAAALAKVCDKAHERAVGTVLAVEKDGDAEYKRTGGASGTPPGALARSGLTPAGIADHATREGAMAAEKARQKALATAARWQADAANRGAMAGATAALRCVLAAERDARRAKAEGTAPAPAAGAASVTRARRAAKRALEGVLS